MRSIYVKPKISTCWFEAALLAQKDWPSKLVVQSKGLRHGMVQFTTLIELPESRHLRAKLFLWKLSTAAEPDSPGKKLRAAQDNTILAFADGSIFSSKRLRAGISSSSQSLHSSSPVTSISILVKIVKEQAVCYKLLQPLTMMTAHQTDHTHLPPLSARGIYYSRVLL